MSMMLAGSCRVGMLSAQGKLVPPFTYEALPPADIEFVPLKQTQSFRADALMQVQTSCPFLHCQWVPWLVSVLMRS